MRFYSSQGAFITCQAGVWIVLSGGRHLGEYLCGMVKSECYLNQLPEMSTEILVPFLCLEFFIIVGLGEGWQTGFPSFCRGKNQAPAEKLQILL